MDTSRVWKVLDDYEWMTQKVPSRALAHNRLCVDEGIHTYLGAISDIRSAFLIMEALAFRSADFAVDCVLKHLASTLEAASISLKADLEAYEATTLVDLQKKWVAEESNAITTYIPDIPEPIEAPPPKEAPPSPPPILPSPDLELMPRRLTCSPLIK